MAMAGARGALENLYMWAGSKKMPLSREIAGGREIADRAMRGGAVAGGRIAEGGAVNLADRGIYSQVRSRGRRRAAIGAGLGGMALMGRPGGVGDSSGTGGLTPHSSGGATML